MKKNPWILLVLLLICAAPSARAQAAAGWAAIIKAAIKKVVKAADLVVQRRQNAVIKLQNAQKELENTMAKQKLDEITGWVRKQRDLYQEYYQELKKVKAVIAYYFKVKQIAQKQALIVAQYRKAWSLFTRDAHFSASELSYMGKVYEGMLDQTARSIDLLALVVSSFTTQMSDAQRLAIIDQTADQVDTIAQELGSFTQENQLLSLSRAKSELEASVVKELYGID